MSLLSVGFCAWLNEAPPDEIDELDSVYAVQLLLIKRLQQTSRTVASKERYRLVLSDGVHFVHALLATHLNDLVCLGDLVKYSVVVIDRVACQHIQDRRLMIILDLHVISRDEEKIGFPVPPPASAAPASPATRN